jgi:hypothetical protein
MSEAEKEGFLSRWSRRKRALEEAEAAAAAEAPPADPAPVPAPEEEAAPGQPVAARAACPIPEVPEIDPATLPPVESLTIESDFQQFLRPGVPTLLRNAALRRMWSLDPAIRDYIGPVDYQWDFNTPGGLPFGFSNELVGDVGKLLAQAIGKIEELAEDAPGEAEQEAGAEVAEPAIAPPESAPPALGIDPPAAEAPAIEAPAARPEPEAEPAPAPRRRHGGALPA